MSESDTLKTALEMDKTAEGLSLLLGEARARVAELEDGVKAAEELFGEEVTHLRARIAELEAGLGETVTCIEFMQHEVTLWEPGEERQFKAALARARALLEPAP